MNSNDPASRGWRRRTKSYSLRRGCWIVQIGLNAGHRICIGQNGRCFIAAPGDCRDKQQGKSCLSCRIEELEERLTKEGIVTFGETRYDEGCLDTIANVLAIIEADDTCCYYRCNAYYKEKIKALRGEGEDEKRS